MKTLLKTSLILFCGSIFFLFASCATTVNVRLTRPAQLDLNGARTVAVLPFKPGQYYVEYDEHGILTRCSTNKAEIDAKGELVGIHKLSSSFYHKLCVEYEKIIKGNPKLGYEYQLLWMSQNISPVYVLNAYDVSWYEIDDEEDLRFVEHNFSFN